MSSAGHMELTLKTWARQKKLSLQVKASQHEIAESYQITPSTL